MITNIITPTESDVILSQFEDWLVLDPFVKTYHIERASVHIQTKWVCVEITWPDPLTIPQVVKSACAFYALADSYGNLYGNISSRETFPGNIKSMTDKLGTMSTTRVFGSLRSEERKLGYPDALMESVCVSKSGNVELTRV